MALSSGSPGPPSIFHRLVTNSTNSRGGCWQPAFRCYEPLFSCARCTRNTSGQTSSGGGRTGRTVLTFVKHEVHDLFGHEDNPVQRVLAGGKMLRRRIDVADDELDFPI